MSFLFGRCPASGLLDGAVELRSEMFPEATFPADAAIRVPSVTGAARVVDNFSGGWSYRSPEMSNTHDFFAAVKQGETDRVATILIREPMLVHARDAKGATALHYAAERADRDLVRILVAAGASLNARDSQFHATPAGWAIEYLRQMGGLLGIEIEDARFAIERGDVVWLQRLMHRFPSLSEACDMDGVPLKQRAQESKNPRIIAFFS